MKPPTSARPCPALLLLLVLLAVAGEASAEHGRKGRYHHHQHQHEEHRAPRTRREQDPLAEEVTTAGSGDGPPGTDAPTKKSMPCTTPDDCLEFLSSICDSSIKACRCPTSHPLEDEENVQCLKKTFLNHTCKANIQCRTTDAMSYCSAAGTCSCIKGYKFSELITVGLNCVNAKTKSSVNSAMIGVVAGLGLMFVIICVVLRLFSKRRKREGVGFSFTSESPVVVPDDANTDI